MCVTPGRLRPDFLARCKWDAATRACTGCVQFSHPVWTVHSNHHTQKASGYCRWETIFSIWSFINRLRRNDVSIVILGWKNSCLVFPRTCSSEIFSRKPAAALYTVPPPNGLCKLGSRIPGRRLRMFLPLLIERNLLIISQRHHKEDVIVGSIIGIVSASICYFIFWPNPFSIDSFTIESAGRPRAVYREHDFGRSRNTGYELTDMDHDMEPV